MLDRRAHNSLETRHVALEVKVEAESDDFLTISGYGAVFGNMDSHGDVIQPGAFNGSIASGRKVKMLWQHDPNQPIGVWDEMREDENGLFVKGRISTKAAKGQEAAELVKMGAIEGLSIGFRTKADEYDHDNNVRKLKEVELWETSVVTFPSNQLANIYAMKSAENMDKRDLERAFKDMGYSNSMAKAMAGGAWERREHALREAGVGGREDDQREADELKQLLIEIVANHGAE